MTIDEALALLIARTKHERFRELANNPATHASLIALASGQPPPPPPPPPIDPAALAQAMAESRSIRACPHFTRSEVCGCVFGRCSFPWAVGPTTKERCLSCLNLPTA